MAEKWVGTLAFEMEDENHFLAKHKVSFELHLNIENDSIDGQLKHQEYSILTEQIIRITGFRDENFYSLIATFPCRGIYNEAGQMVLDDTQKNHEMAFYGERDESDQTMTGHWESEEKSVLSMGNVEVYISAGPFILNLENN